MSAKIELEKRIQNKKLCRIYKRHLRFFDENGELFAGLNANGVFMSCTKIGSKIWYSFASNTVEKELGISDLKYSERCDLADELVAKYLTNK